MQTFNYVCILIQIAIMTVNKLDLEKFSLVEGDAYQTILHREIFFRKTTKRFIMIRKYIKNQNDDNNYENINNRFSFKYNFKTKIVTLICTLKH
jgi:hypothetical protein